MFCFNYLVASKPTQSNYRSRKATGNQHSHPADSHTTAASDERGPSSSTVSPTRNASLDPDIHPADAPTNFRSRTWYIRDEAPGADK